MQSVWLRICILGSRLPSSPARAVHFVGGLRRSAGARTPDPSLVAYRVSYLGNPYRTASVAVPFDCVGELPGSQGGCGAIPERISASLS